MTMRWRALPAFEPDPNTLMRIRPSVDTSYAGYGISPSSTGVPILRDGCVFTGTIVSLYCKDAPPDPLERKYTARPALDHRGAVPPDADTCTLNLSTSGKGRT